MMYDGRTAQGKPGGRFLTITGHKLPDAPATVESRQDIINELYEKRFVKPASAKKSNGREDRNGHHGGGFGFRASTAGDADPGQIPLNDAELARWKCLGIDMRNKIIALWDGDTSGYATPSEADAALASYLVILTNGDRARAECALRVVNAGEAGKVGAEGLSGLDV